MKSVGAMVILTLTLAGCSSIKEANQGTEENPSNTVSKIDIATKKVVATIETGKGSHGVVTSPDNKFVYVTNMYDNTVSVIDNSTNKVIAIVKLDKTPNCISYRE